MTGLLLEMLSRMAWRDIVLAHWATTDTRELAARLPAGVTLDLYEGQAWISVVAFVAVGPAPAPMLLPGLELAVTYRQLNVRTYGHDAHGAGIVLLETLVDRPFAALPRLFGLPYELDRELSVELRADGALAVRLSQDRLVGAVDEDGLLTPAPGSRDAFLLDRCWVFGETRRQRPYAVRLAHPPWRVRPAWVRSTSRGPADLAHHAPFMDRIRIAEVTPIRQASRRARVASAPAPRAMLAQYPVARERRREPHT